MHMIAEQCTAWFLVQEITKLVDAVGQLRATKGLRGGVNSAWGLLLGSSMWADAPLIEAAAGSPLCVQ